MPCAEQLTCNGYLRLDCHWCDKDSDERDEQNPDTIPSVSVIPVACPLGE